MAELAPFEMDPDTEVYPLAETGSETRSQRAKRELSCEHRLLFLEIFVTRKYVRPYY
jgi:hypothetical protein